MVALSSGFHGGPKHSAQIASSGIADLVQLASDHNKPVKFSVQLHPSHKDYNKFLKSGDHKDIKDFKKSLLVQLDAELGRRGHLTHSSKKISNDVVNGMSIALGHPESTPSLKLKKSELNPSLRATAFSEEVITPDDLIRLKLNEHKVPEFLRKAPKDSQRKFAAALRAGLEAARKRKGAAK